METKRGFKFVHKIDGKLYSAGSFRNVVQQQLKSGSSVEYKIGEFVYPKYKHKPLFVFNTLDDAKAWMRPDNDWIIFECEYVEASDEVQDFFTSRVFSSSNFLIGTILASKVALIKET